MVGTSSAAGPVNRNTRQQWLLARKGGGHYQQSKCNGCDEPFHNRLRSLSASRKSKTGASLDGAGLAETADSGLTDRRSEIHWNINTFHFSERIIRSEPGGKRGRCWIGDALRT